MDAQARLSLRWSPMCELQAPKFSSPQRNLDRFKAVLIFRIIMLFLSCFMLSCTSVYCCLVVTCWERADPWLSFVMSNCEVTFPLVSWVRCGAWLYRFLFFVLFLTLMLVLNRRMLTVQRTGESMTIWDSKRALKGRHLTWPTFHIADINMTYIDYAE